MSNQKIVRYNIDALVNEDATINIVYGERSNGKSYQIKHKRAILNYLENGNRFILMRRWKEEITTEKIEAYFADVDIIKITNGKYNCITCYRKTLYLSNYNLESGKTIRGEKIGYVVALSTEQNYAGASYLDVTDIIFEEFMSRSEYLGGESDKLMNFYSTVDRKRGTTKLWLVGNSISRVCPYLVDWGLDEIVRVIKQGEIRVKYLGTNTFDDSGNEIMVKLAMEHAPETGRTSFAIGKHRDMMNKGTWQTDPQPHLPKSKKEYKSIYKIMFYYKSFKFLGEYLIDKENYSNRCWFISPYTKDIKDNILVFSDIVKISKWWQRNIYDPNINNDNIKKLLQTFRENMIFYASDLCGTDFKQAIDFEIKK